MYHGNGRKVILIDVGSMNVKVLALEDHA